MLLRNKLALKYFETGHLSFELQPLFQTSRENRAWIEKKLFWDDMKKGVDTKYYEKYNVMLQTMHPLKKAILRGDKCVPLRLSYCNNETNIRYYDSEGDIYSCTPSVGDKKGKIGVYFPDYKLKKESYVTRNVMTISSCQKCKYALICGGGCAHRIQNEEGNIMVENCFEMNELINKEIPDILKRAIKSND